MPAVTFPLRTERLELRPFLDDDFDVLYAMQSHLEVTRYLYWGPRSPDQVREMLERIKPMTAFDDSGDAIRLAAVVIETGAVVGDISLRRTSQEYGQGEIGFVVHPDHQGRGYATEASAAVLDLGFGELGLHRIVGRADAKNLASARVMERLGMRREALLRENEFIKGEWSDEVVYAILADEWRGRVG